MEFPIRNKYRTCYRQPSRNLSDQSSVGRFLAGTFREGYKSNGDRTLGLSADNARRLRRSPFRRSNRGKFTRYLPSSRGIRRTTVKLPPSATQISSQPPPQGLRRHGSVFSLLIAGAVADDGPVDSVHNGI